MHCAGSSLPANTTALPQLRERCQQPRTALFAAFVPINLGSNYWALCAPDGFFASGNPFKTSPSVKVTLKASPSAVYSLGTP